MDAFQSKRVVQIEHFWGEKNQKKWNVLRVNFSAVWIAPIFRAHKEQQTLLIM